MGNLFLILSLVSSTLLAQPPHSGTPSSPSKRAEVKESPRELRVQILDKLAKIEKLAMSPAADPAELKKLSEDLDRVLKGDIGDSCPVPKKRDAKQADALRKSIQATLAKSMSEKDAMELALQLEPKILDERLYELAFNIFRKSEYPDDAVKRAAKLASDAAAADRLDMIQFAFEILKKSEYESDALTQAVKLVGELPRSVTVASVKDRYDVYLKSEYSNDALKKAVATFTADKKK